MARGSAQNAKGNKANNQPASAKGAGSHLRANKGHEADFDDFEPLVEPSANRDIAGVGIAVLAIASFIAVISPATAPVTAAVAASPLRQRLPLWGSWREAPERARPLPENHKRNDSIALTEGLLIAAQRLSEDGLALSVCFAATSPRGRGSGVPVRLTRDERSFLYRKQ